MVTTPSGSDGLRLRTSPSDSAPLFTAHSTQQFIDTVVEVFSNGEVWRLASAAALAHANQNFNLAAQAYDLEQAINIAFINREAATGRPPSDVEM